MRGSRVQPGLGGPLGDQEGPSSCHQAGRDLTRAHRVLDAALPVSLCPHAGQGSSAALEPSVWRNSCCLEPVRHRETGIHYWLSGALWVHTGWPKLQLTVWVRLVDWYPGASTQAALHPHPAEKGQHYFAFMYGDGAGHYGLVGGCGVLPLVTDPMIQVSVLLSWNALPPAVPKTSSAAGPTAPSVASPCALHGLQLRPCLQAPRTTFADPKPLGHQSRVAFAPGAQVRPCLCSVHGPSGSDISWSLASCSSCGESTVPGVGAQGRTHPPTMPGKAAAPGRPENGHVYPAPLYTWGLPCTPTCSCVYLHTTCPGSLRVCLWGVRDGGP